MTTNYKGQTSESQQPDLRARFKSWLARLALIFALVGLPTLAPQQAPAVSAQAARGVGAGIFISGDITDNVDFFLADEYPNATNDPFEPPGGPLDSFDANFTILDGLAVGDVVGGDNIEACLKGRLNGAPGQDFKFFGCDHIHIVPIGATLANPDSGGEQGAPDDGDSDVFLPLISR